MSPVTVVRVRFRPPLPMVPCMLCAVPLSGKVEVTVPFTAVAVTSAFALLGISTVTLPVTVVNSKSRSQSPRPIEAVMDPVTVVADARPRVEISTLPVTDVAKTLPSRFSASMPPVTVAATNATPAGSEGPAPPVGRFCLWPRGLPHLRPLPEVHSDRIADAVRAPTLSGRLTGGNCTTGSVLQS